ncbi:DUF3906 family protein [Sporolactobacillus terrae]|uniref:DUF3906 family protein n=1 Tax=Sporolactobacillus terrae TaxID=269673 RepID=UPI0004915EB6|nr:DUF3906 family protein [Sporolactobacillus terrae]
MELFRFIVTAGTSEIPVVAVAENEEAAFRVVDQELDHTLLKLPQIDHIALMQKKSISKKGSGFAILPREQFE